MAMDLPDEKGTYVLIASVSQMKRIEIGRLGCFDIIPGYYAYVGSAFGSGGLRARLGHHLEATANPHWHIDYLLQVAQHVINHIREDHPLPRLQQVNWRGTI
jgi:Uri superfamily endonuclease